MPTKNFFQLPENRKNMLGAIVTAIAASGAVALQLFAVASRDGLLWSTRTSLSSVIFGLVAMLWTLVANVRSQAAESDPPRALHAG